MRRSKSFCIEEYEMRFRNLPKEFDGVTILFLSDLHNVEYGVDHAELLEAVRTQKPDWVFAGGDMVVGKPGFTAETAKKLMEALAKEHKVICANGNHEYRMKLYTEVYGTEYEDYKRALQEAGICYLENSSTKLYKDGAAITVTGLELDRHYYQRGKKQPMDVSYLLETIGEKEMGFQILLAHNPLYLPEYARWGADLILSGHNHGGLIRLPLLGGLVSPQMRFFPKYDAGYYRIKASQAVISRGLGMHTFPIRIGNRPELSKIILKKKRK